MATINASNIGVTINETEIGRSDALAFDLGTDLPDASSRGGLGWAEHIQGIKNASLSIAGLTDYSQNINYNEFAAFVLTGEEVSFEFVFGDIRFLGVGRLESIEQLATFEDVANYNLELVVNNATTLIQGFWILRNGIWEDLGIWLDSGLWID